MKILVILVFLISACGQKPKEKKAAIPEAKEVKKEVFPRAVFNKCTGYWAVTTGIGYPYTGRVLIHTLCDAPERLFLGEYDGKNRLDIHVGAEDLFSDSLEGMQFYRRVAAMIADAKRIDDSARDYFYDSLHKKVECLHGYKY